MFKLKYLILLASLTYIIVIGGGVVGFRYFISLPELQKNADTLVEFEIQQTESALLRVEDELLKSLAAMDFTQTGWTQSSDRTSFLYSGPPSRLEPHLDKLNKNQLITTEMVDEFLLLAKQSRRSRVSYLSLGNNLYQLGIIKNNRESRFVVTDVAGHWLEALSFDLDAKLAIQVFDDQSHSLNPARIPLLDSRGEITAYIQVISSVKTPYLLDAQTVFGALTLISLPILITLLVATIFVIPMTRLIHAIKSMSINNQATEIKTEHFIYELGALTRAFNELLFKLGRQHQLLKHETLTDKLTGISNRRAFDQTLQHDWRFALRTKIPLTVVLADIDHFKSYNDFYGHQAGDEALAAVALALRSCCRRATEFVARYGGEEFGFILQAEGDPAHFLSSVNQAVRDLNIPHAQSSCAEILTISVGACSFFPTAGEDIPQGSLEAILKLADDALYKCKKNGRNRFSHVVFPPSTPMSEDAE